MFLVCQIPPGPFERFATCCSSTLLPFWGGLLLVSKLYFLFKGCAPCFSNTLVTSPFWAICSLFFMDSHPFRAVCLVTFERFAHVSQILPFERLVPCFSKTLVPFGRFHLSQFLKYFRTFRRVCFLFLKHSSPLRADHCRHFPSALSTPEARVTTNETTFVALHVL